MTNSDQDVTLDEMARSVVEWMDGWVIQETKPMTMIGRDGRMSLALSQLYESLDVIREVEEALDDISTQRDNYFRDYMVRVGSKGNHIEWPYYHDAKEIFQADPETRLRAIYATLRESGEI